MTRLWQLSTTLIIILVVPLTASAARVIVIPQGSPLPPQGPLSFEEVLDQLNTAPDRPELDEISDDLLSLFRSNKDQTSHPAVADPVHQVVFAWEHWGGDLVVAGDGTASFRESGVLGWTNGWFDLAMMESVPGLKQLNPVHFLASSWPLWRLRLTNRTGEVATLYDFRGRPLAVVKPQETIERFLVNRIDPEVLGNVMIHEVCLLADYSVGFESGVRLPLDPPGGLRARGVEYSREVTRGGVTLSFGRDESTGLYIATLTPREHSTPTWLFAVSIVAIGVVSLILRWLLTSGRRRSVEE